MSAPRHERQKNIAFYGHFDSSNFGNESTLQAILHYTRRFEPESKITCICTGPDATRATHHVEAVPLADRFIPLSIGRTRLTRWLLRLSVSLPSEACRWVRAFIRLRRTDMLIIPGTGLLTDAYGLLGWGPYTLLKWSVIAKLRRCKLLFVSVGAGPIYSAPGRWLVKFILSLADFRSYRDGSTMQYLQRLGVDTHNDRVFPDLAFSLPESEIPRRRIQNDRRSVVGLGVMEYAGRYSGPAATDSIYQAYLESFATVVKSLLARECDVRLLIGDLADLRAKNDLRTLLEEQLPAPDLEHVVDEPIQSVDQLLSQIAATDIVIATRFHNIVLALLCAKPVISISFHDKCKSLMDAMGLSQYCLDINKLTAEQLIDKLREVEENADIIMSMIKSTIGQFRESLNEQYRAIFAIS